MTGLQILRAGPVCTLQDGGRIGWLRFGVTPAGPMDWIAHATANLLGGNPRDGAALEIGPGGIEVTPAGGALRLGISAPGFVVRRGRSLLPTRMALTLHPGEVLTVEPGPEGTWAYLAPCGGVMEPLVMGSHSTHLRSGIGPMGGMAIRAGQTIRVPPGAGPVEPDIAVILPAIRASGRVRFVPGPQVDFFSTRVISVFTTSLYRVGSKSDRMGYRLDGPPLEHAKGHDIVSDAIAMGAIQVPGDGMPIVLMADRQPTGGYPKIGTVIRADLPILAQARPGRGLRFEAVTVEAAVDALRDAVPSLEALRPHLRRVRIARAPGA